MGLSWSEKRIRVYSEARGQISPLRANSPPFSCPTPLGSIRSAEGHGVFHTASAGDQHHGFSPLPTDTSESFLSKYILNSECFEDADEGLCLNLNFEQSQPSGGRSRCFRQHEPAHHSVPNCDRARTTEAAPRSPLGQVDLRKKLPANPRQHACQYCEKLFKTRSNLNQHVRTHLGAIFRCEECDKAFTESGYRYHLLTHRQEKPFICHVCAKSFVQNKLLKKHIASCHSEVRNFPCPHCPSSFKRKDHLSRHVSDIHERTEKLFQCSFDDCLARFKTSHRLKVHLRRHQEKSQVNCEICPQKFLSKRHLHEHLRQKHASSSDTKTDVASVLSKLYEDDDRAFDDFLCEIIRADDEFRLKPDQLHNLLLPQAEF
eukprot:maker-scaffold1562_size35716-snap-gene-0.4 protein:Tk12359 transcript:maker-scaffold1562_size35716-snap-gene-0.4-mRNA-1 annotation:"zinc finger protein 778-like"